jgi:hypothetical protein
MWQTLPSAAEQVSFSVHGGHGEIVLLENSSGLPASGNAVEISSSLHSGLYGKVVRRVTGMNNNTDFAWTWSLTAYDRSSLVIAVVDDLAESWGFVSFSELTIKTDFPSAGVSDWALY